MKAIEGKRVIFYCPKYDNDGYPLSEEMLEFKNKALIEFGGFTEHQEIYGNWVDNDKYYQDTIVPIEIAGFRNDEHIQIIANKLKRELKQEAIYLIIDGRAFIH